MKDKLLRLMISSSRTRLRSFEEPASFAHPKKASQKFRNMIFRDENEMLAKIRVGGKERRSLNLTLLNLPCEFINDRRNV